MASQWPPVKGVAFTLYFTLYTSAGTVVANPGTITKKVSIDGGDVADIVAFVTEENTTYGQCSLVLSAAEMNGDAIWVYIADDTAGCVPFTATLYTAAQTLDTIDDLLDTEVAAIKAKTDTIGALAVSILSPVASSGDITIYQKDDYSAADARSITATAAVADVPSLTGATITLKCGQATWTATGQTSDGSNWSIVFEPTSAQTAALTIARQKYELQAVLATSGHIVTLATGMLIVVDDIPAVT
jgi:hypothetical protein